MRVITGSARGMTLTTLEGEDVRPTTDRVKEAIFSIIQFEIEGRTVLDLFAGSGQLGIEALSRGAEKAYFVDSSGDSVAVVKKNLEHTRLMSSAVVLQADSPTFVRNSKESFGVVFLDPPYGRGLVQRVLPDVSEHMQPGGVIICETPVGEELPERAGGSVLHRRYKYGKIEITVYRTEAEG